jgi:L-amino acid N-acyltransferase YncA
MSEQAATMIVRACAPTDVAQICDIYNHYIERTVITFEETPVALDEMQARVATVTQRYPWLVAVDAQGQVLGYAYASAWKTRAAYRHTAETTVYVRDGRVGQGCGKALYAALLARLDAQGCHVALGCIALPNAASVRLHEHFGFAKVAHFNEVGRKFEQWLDVGYWQRVSPVAS